MRRLELDSLRGLAALSVLIYHALAINLDLFARGSELQPVSGWFENVLLYSPLRIIWSGGEAVWLFFLLSGFVLTNAATSARFTWASYFPSRVVRLYVPVIGAIALTWLSFVIVPHVITTANERFLGGAATGYPVSTLINDALVITGPSTTLGPLWSLQWEVLFSLALPLYVYLSRKNVWVISAVSSLAFLVGFAVTNQFLMYMPMFMFGSLVAQNWDRIAARVTVSRDDSAIKHAIAAFVLIAGITLAMSYWIGANFYNSLGIPRISAVAAFAPVKIIGLLVILVIAQTWEPLQRALSTRLLVFLGTISFSLYLVHWPVVISTAFLIGPGPNSAVLGLVVSIALSYVFYWAIEKRAHATSRNLANSIRSIS